MLYVVRRLVRFFKSDRVRKKDDSKVFQRLQVACLRDVIRHETQPEGLRAYS